MDKRGNLQNVGCPVFFTPGAIAKLSFICDGEVTFICDGEVTLKLKKQSPKAKESPIASFYWAFLRIFLI